MVPLSALRDEEIFAEGVVPQPQLSVLERNDDRLVSTFRRYVETLGDELELELVAKIGDRRTTLRGV